MHRLIAVLILTLALLSPASALAHPATPAVTCCYAIAQVSNPTPTQNSTETITGRLVDSARVGVGGATLHTVWHYKTTTPSCDGGPTGPNGFAQCARSISRATIGYQVLVDITFTTTSGATYATQTSFTPQ